jgi:hypothetical protein
LIHIATKNGHFADNSDLLKYSQEIAMRIGVPKEIKNNEFRVGLTPASVRELVSQWPSGHGAEQRGHRDRSG